jgi:hypothetical protein
MLNRAVHLVTRPQTAEVIDWAMLIAGALSLTVAVVGTTAGAIFP